MSGLYTKIGLEVHVQLKTASKLFSSAPVAPSRGANTAIQLFDVAIPGTLPVLNRRCVELAIKTAKICQCEINKVSIFERKHYFYPDLPAGYQITQNKRPIAVNGLVEYAIEHPKYALHTCRIRQIQLEQDAGRTLSADNNATYIDFNRADTPLIEIVTEPDFCSAEEVSAFVRYLRSLLYLNDVSRCVSRDGNIRVDANVSLSKHIDRGHRRVEIKNINSDYALRRGIRNEIQRQINLIEQGVEIEEETRNFDNDSCESKFLRLKASQDDYRFINEPNLLPLRLSTQLIDSCQTVTLPNTKEVAVKHQIEELHAGILIKSHSNYHEFIRLVEEEKLLAAECSKYESISPSRLLKFLNRNVFSERAVLSNNIDRELLNMVIIRYLCNLLDERKITEKTCFRVFKSSSLSSVEEIEAFLSENELWQIIDEHQIRQLVLGYLAEEENEKPLSQARGGKRKAASYLLNHFKRRHFIKMRGLMRFHRSIWSSVEMARRDPILDITAAFNADQRPFKVNLGIGSYKDEEGRGQVLQCVRHAERELISDRDNTYDHEYLSIGGCDKFIKSAMDIAFGYKLADKYGDRLAAVQTIAGVGGLRLACEFLKRLNKNITVCIPNDTWPNHSPIIEAAGLHPRSYRYYDRRTNSIDMFGLLQWLDHMEPAIVLFHVVGHNPCGIDPTNDQWVEIAKVMKARNHIALFDFVYQGLASGDVFADSFAVRHFLEDDQRFIVSQSLSKIFGLYSQRVGCLYFKCDSNDERERVTSQLRSIIRPLWSNPPAHGARIVTRIVQSPVLYAIWKGEVMQMAKRMRTMREKLYSALTDGDNSDSASSSFDWSHLLTHRGMFWYSGLSMEQMKELNDKYAIYGQPSGRFSVTGLTENNYRHVANALLHVTK